MEVTFAVLSKSTHFVLLVMLYQWGALLTVMYYWTFRRWKLMLGTNNRPSTDGTRKMMKHYISSCDVLMLFPCPESRTFSYCCPESKTHTCDNPISTCLLLLCILWVNFALKVNRDTRLTSFSSLPWMFVDSIKCRLICYLYLW